MANFVALTPPLGQQPWGPVLILAPVAPVAPTTINALPVVLPANLSLADVGYPPLDSLFRTIILSKHPGTIFPDPRLENGLHPSPTSSPSILIRESRDEIHSSISRVSSAKLCSSPPFLKSQR